MATNAEQYRVRRKYSLDLMRNFGIMSGLAFTVTLATQVLSRAGANSVFQTLQATLGVALSMILMCGAITYVLVEEAWNTPVGFPNGARVPALFVTSVLVCWHVVYLTTFFTRELNA